jgi:hypothetical protein
MKKATGLLRNDGIPVSLPLEWRIEVTFIAALFELLNFFIIYF